jgi:hypothetical protein
MTARERHPLEPCFGMHVRGIDDREAARPEPHVREVVEGVEGIVRCRLVVLVVGHHAAQHIG